MREAVSLSLRRLPYWIFGIVTALFVTVNAGLIPSPYAMLTWLANRPAVATAFHDQALDRADAMVLLFGSLFLAPFAIMVGLVALIFAMGIFGGLVLPVVRWFTLPDWFATVIAALAVSALAYIERGTWVPRSLWVLGLLARACLVVIG